MSNRRLTENWTDIAAQRLKIAKAVLGIARSRLAFVIVKGSQP